MLWAPLAELCLTVCHFRDEGIFKVLKQMQLFIKAFQGKTLAQILVDHSFLLSTSHPRLLQ